MPKKVAILQSNYIPWKGYFDLINYVDEFILYDSVQFTKNDWRNRNRIKTQNGPAWLSIPVRHSFGQLIRDTEVSDPAWSTRHWKTIEQSYSKAAFFPKYRETFRQAYAARPESHLSLINVAFLTTICEVLGIHTRLSWSTDYSMIEGQTERLVSLCQQAGATEYLSGPAARDYLRAELFAEADIALRFIDYGGYPPYRQLHGAFEHGVSVLDLIFNEGPDAPRFMKSFSGIAAHEAWVPEHRA